MKFLRDFGIMLFLLTGVCSQTITAQERAIGVKPVKDYSIASSWTMQFPKENSLIGYLGLRYFDNLKNRLLKIDEEALLDGFLHRPGKHPWIGEHVGKYLESAANTWAITKDP
ncbi:MAG: hypothetical protein ABI288_01765, partial [Ginsengibacter sp.]